MHFLPLPEKKYSIVYVDPPWAYNDKALAGNRGAGHHYGTLSTQELMTLPVSNIAEDDSVMFMWVTMPMLTVFEPVMNAWGYDYKTCAFTWIKKTKNDKMHWGMGNWTRSNPELCLLGTRGKPKRLCAAIHSVLEEKVGRHSEKPATTRDKIVELVGDLPRIELFARTTTPGWDSWGNEV
jgi:N6-adenosine-specific RNA methylase IME4